MGRFALKWMGCGTFSGEMTILYFSYISHFVASSATRRSLRLLIKTIGKKFLWKKNSKEDLLASPRIIKRSDSSFP